LPKKPKLHYSNVISFMYDKNLVSFGHVPVVVNASTWAEGKWAEGKKGIQSQLCN
jgi:hypothetical protein